MKKPKNPINVRTPEFRPRVEDTKKGRLNKQLKREAERDIREYMRFYNENDEHETT